MRSWTLVVVALAPLALAASGPPKCTIYRGCGQGKNLADDELCAMKANVLKHVVHCVHSKPKMAMGLCSYDLNDQNARDTQQDFTIWFNQVKNTLGCITPKNILLRASQKAGKKASLHGAIKTCPSDNGKFHDCMCHHNTRDENLNHFAAKFADGSAEDLYCKKKKKRDARVEPPPGLMASLRKRDLSDWIQDGGYLFFIDDDGRPNYNNGAIGYPLPYYQSFIWENTGIERCYIMPFSTNRYCVDWLLDGYMASSPWVQGPWTQDNVTYGDNLRAAVAATTTARNSVEPPVASAPPTSALPDATGPVPTTDVGVVYSRPASGAAGAATAASQIQADPSAPTGFDTAGNSGDSGSGKKNAAAAFAPVVLPLLGLVFGLQLLLAM
ncbi:hypothetical protein VHEMI06455 [[Torrubiella] hemipterigena]|uniref:Secreted protein n=1 Tax=[Torrubiella] hemipterigena TaxID=1531966 RepID=A0A0A1TJ84_9HYPO|nr:hypothetical protein VHEMI06455 [[Torrubiella] hemipterigena]